MSRLVTIHIDLDQLETEKATLEAQIAELERKLDQVRRRIEAAPLFLQDGSAVNGAATTSVVVQPGPLIKGSEADLRKDEPTPLPQMVLALIRAKGPMTTIQIRDALLSVGFPREKLGATFSYLYTVLGRLIASKRLERSGDKYRLPRGAMLALVPEEATAG